MSDYGGPIAWDNKLAGLTANMYAFVVNFEDDCNVECLFDWSESGIENRGVTGAGGNISKSSPPQTIYSWERPGDPAKVKQSLLMGPLKTASKGGCSKIAVLTDLPTIFVSPDVPQNSEQVVGSLKVGRMGSYWNAVFSFRLSWQGISHPPQFDVKNFKVEQPGGG